MLTRIRKRNVKICNGSLLCRAVSSCVAAPSPQGETGCGLRGNRHHRQIHSDHHHGGGDGDDDGVSGETLGEMSCHDGAHTLGETRPMGQLLRAVCVCAALALGPAWCQCRGSRYGIFQKNEYFH